MSESNLAVADRLFKSIENGDIDAVNALYHPDIRVWHNFSNAEQTREQNLAVLKGMVEAVPHIRYEVLERQLLGDRVLQRHHLRCRTDSGQEFLIPACIFLTVHEGRITRIDEYLDTGQANALRFASGREPVSI